MHTWGGGGVEAYVKVQLDYTIQLHFLYQIQHPYLVHMITQSTHGHEKQARLV